MPEMFTLATRPRHQWGERKIFFAHESEDGHERHVKQCPACLLKTITVIPLKGDAWRAYQYVEGPEHQREREPACAGSVTQEDEGRAA